MKYGFENDRTLLRLYDIKRRSHDLGKNEKQEFDRLDKLYRLSNDFFIKEIDPVLVAKKFIIDINQVGTEDTPDGGTRYLRQADSIEYRITELGIEAIKNNTFDSESKQRIETEYDRRTTRKIAYYAIFISSMTFLLELVKELITLLKDG